jgi:mannosyltransferase OCH1-like enzyme
MIPKIIHLVWFGGVRPKFFDYCVETIKNVNNDYEIKEWNDNNIDFPLINKKLFDATENYGSKSDIFRIEVLNRYGGIYMDYDFIQLKKYDGLLNYNFFASGGNYPEVWNGLIGSIPNHPICIDYIEGLKNSTPVLNSSNPIQSTMEKTGPYYFTKIFNKHSNLDKVVYLDKRLFYMFDPDHRHGISELDEQTINFIKSFAVPESINVHFHACSWQKTLV